MFLLKNTLHISKKYLGDIHISWPLKISLEQAEKVRDFTVVLILYFQTI